MPSTYLDPSHRVVRYVPWARLRKDENDNPIGVIRAAFELRPVDDYLSATWAEFFSGNDSEQIRYAIVAIRGSNLKPKPKSGFAVGIVDEISKCCSSHEKPARIRFVHEEEDDNAAHAALRGWPRENDDLLDLIADEVWNELILNSAVESNHPTGQKR